MIFQPDTTRGALCEGGAQGAYICGDGNMIGGKVPARTTLAAINDILAGEPHKSIPKASGKYKRSGGGS
jgi:hypothetical protein